MPFTATIAPGIGNVIVGGNGPYQAGDVVTMTDAAYAAMDPAAFDIFTAPPVFQGGEGAVTSVNGQSGAVMLDAADVGAISQMAKAVTNFRVTSGNVSPLPNTSGGWIELDPKYRVSITASPGDLIYATLDIAYDPQGTNQRMDLASYVGGAAVRYGSSGTATPAANGDPALSYAPGQARTTGFSRMYVATAPEISGGTVTYTLMTLGPGSGGTVYSSASSPYIVDLVNLGPSGL